MRDARDCDDTTAAAFPFNPEICDGVDNDCNDFVDDGLPFETWYADADADGYGDRRDKLSACEEPLTGYADVGGDCDDASSDVFPGHPELCDGVDNDCGGGPDDGLAFEPWYEDADGDGYGSAVEISTCADPGDGWAASSGDCDDASAAVGPGASEACNGIDDDCDGAVDPDCGEPEVPPAKGGCDSTGGPGGAAWLGVFAAVRLLSDLWRSSAATRAGRRSARSRR